MYSRLNSASVFGINAFIVEIETHMDNALPAMSIVGLPDSAVKESRERVSAAIKNSNMVFPNKRITVNLAPADIRKEGSAFDLPVAVGVLSSMGVVQSDILSETIILGELALDGTLRPIHGTLSITLEAIKNKFKRIILPEDNAEEAALVDNIEVIPVSSLSEAITYINGDLDIPPKKIDIEKLFLEGERENLYNLSDVKGQENVKRALEVSAAGGHNMLMIGLPAPEKLCLQKEFHLFCRLCL